MRLLFMSAAFLGAFLLFCVQPMIAKMVLPRFGGSPAVWNTCMVFFQAALLAGYGIAHATSGRLDARRQTLLHLGLLVLPTRGPADRRPGEPVRRGRPVPPAAGLAADRGGVAVPRGRDHRPAAPALVRRVRTIAAPATLTSCMRPATRAACWPWSDT